MCTPILKFSINNSSCRCEKFKTNSKLAPISKKIQNPIILSHQFLDFKIINISDAKSILNQCQGKTQNSVFISYPKSDKDKVNFLEKILSAVKLDLKKDVLVLEKTPTNDFSFSALHREVQIKKAILFGMTPQSVGLQVNCQKYQPFTIGNCLYLFADELTTIEGNQQLKKLLWVALQNIFLTK